MLPKSHLLLNLAAVKYVEVYKSGFDVGIRSGADSFKAVALGADFVQLRRLIFWN